MDNKGLYPPIHPRLNYHPLILVPLNPDSGLLRELGVPHRILAISRPPRKSPPKMSHKTTRTHITPPTLWVQTELRAEAAGQQVCTSFTTGPGVVWGSPTHELVGKEWGTLDPPHPLR
eukprot:766272-Hanusia_phi.AAC.7